MHVGWIGPTLTNGSIQKGQDDHADSRSGVHGEPSLHSRPTLAGQRLGTFHENHRTELSLLPSLSLPARHKEHGVFTDSPVVRIPSDPMRLACRGAYEPGIA